MSAGLVTYLMTAGQTSDDYRFLGRAPKDPFWRRYAEYTSFERPTALVLARDDVFRAYVSGILSARRDRTRTPLRYTMVLEGPCGGDGAVLVLRALAAFLEDLGEISGGPQKMGSLGRALDSAFPEPFVESALTALRDGGDPEQQPLSEIPERLARGIESLPDSAPRMRSDIRFFWGGRASEPARAQLLGYAERLLVEGESGAALIVNLASREHLEQLGGSESSCGVLFAGEASEEAFSDPLEWPPKKGRPGSPKGLPRAIELAREAQAEPGWSMRWGQLLRGVFQTVRGWFLGRRESS